MPDDLTRTQPEDPTKINLSQSWEVTYWCGTLNVSVEILRKAVDAVGVMVDDVKKYLGIN